MNEALFQRPVKGSQPDEKTLPGFIIFRFRIKKTLNLEKAPKNSYPKARRGCSSAGRGVLQIQR